MRRPLDVPCRSLNTQVIVGVPRPLKTAGTMYWRIQGGGRGNSPPHSTLDRGGNRILPLPNFAKAGDEDGQWSVKNRYFKRFSLLTRAQVAVSATFAMVGGQNDPRLTRKLGKLEGRAIRRSKALSEPIRSHLSHFSLR